MAAMVIVGFRYRTLEGRDFSGNYASSDSSPLYQMDEGDEFSLSYNPSKPDCYWSDLYGLGLGDHSLLVTIWLIAFVTILILVASSK
jgi:hypothetical protein